MTTTGTAMERLRQHLHTTRLLGSIHSTLYYDQNTVLPVEGVTWRGEQLALLACQLHERQSSEAYAELVAEAEASLDADAGPETRRNLMLLRRELERQRCLDPDLVGRLAQAQAQGYAIWQVARRAANFQVFAPALAELLNLRREEAAQLALADRAMGDPPRSRWETLAQRFEPGISEQLLEDLFSPLSERLPELIRMVQERRAGSGASAVNHSWDLAEQVQDDLCRQLLEEWGFDPRRCRRDRSPHPFSCTLGPQDFRITTRVVAGQPFSAFLATAHEWGHSLYEQGLPRGDDHWFPWPLGEATSMAVHESQSLFLECRLARSEAFAARWHPRFQGALGADPWGGAAGFWRQLNPMRPGLIRVEADELGYALHIVLRYELERALLENELKVADLPAVWNRRMGELLGVRPGNDAEGCLQDVHWSEGLFGYFPSYAVGHLVSAQLAEAMERDLGPIEERLRRGEDQTVFDWLAERVWPLGRSVEAGELVELVSGAPLTAAPFLTYLEGKLERLAG
jgi:carboxypeptidase Taq